MNDVDQRIIHIDPDDQTLRLYEGNRLLNRWPVSTARNGLGEHYNSGCTPRGEHRIRLKIGADCLPNTVFVGRRPTGEIYTEKLAREHPGRDWILSRILWLTGCRSGFNRGGECDTLKRYIYIHGCPDSEPIGVPASHGCIRMRNGDVIDLFDLVSTGCPVLIGEREPST